MANKQKPKEAEQKRRRRALSEEADWSAQDGDLLKSIIANVTGDGGAIRFGYSRDGGAYSLGIYGDGKPFTEFCPASTDVDTWLRGIELDYE